MKKTASSSRSAVRSTRGRKSCGLESEKWWRDFKRRVDLGRLAPRSRASYLCWVRQLHEAFPHRDPTKLRENEVLDFLISLRQQRKLKDSTVNQAVCALRAFYRDWSVVLERRIERSCRLHGRDYTSSSFWVILRR